MKLLINISDDVYQTILATHDNMIFDSDSPYVAIAIKNGTQLPKGHGRLIDEERISLSGIHFETERDHAMMIGRLNSAPTIIEADKESEG